MGSAGFCSILIHPYEGRRLCGGAYSFFTPLRKETNRRILAVGDVCGAPGLQVLERRLHGLQKLEQIDLTIVNGENANMRGLTPQQAQRIFDCGADVITLGNHSFAQRSICDYLDDNSRILRPLNMAPQLPGGGVCRLDWNGVPVCVVNLMGRLNMDFHSSDPFAAMDALLKKEEAQVVLVDFHAEATSEKKALGYFLDGRASEVYGTHTHVQTADEHVLPQGTGYITDVGMTGALESVIGVRYEQSVSYFRGDLGPRFASSELDLAVQGAIFDIEEKTGRCTGVQRVTVR